MSTIFNILTDAQIKEHIMYMFDLLSGFAHFILPGKYFN